MALEPPSRRTERALLVLGALWAGLAGVVMWQAPAHLGAVGAAVPLGLIGLAWWLARQLRQMQEEALAMQEGLEALRAADAALARSAEPAPFHDPSPLVVPTPQDGGAQPPAEAPQPAHLSDRPRAAFVRAGTAAGPAATLPFSSRRAASAPAGTAPAGGQGMLPLDAPPPPPPLNTRDFIAALNFPQDPEDTDGFRALRRALKHPETAPLVQAAQDMLTLMSQIGLYMDDLSLDRPRPDLWRRFADGERGGALAALGGIRDAAAEEVCAVQMRSDAVFRDTAHHFLRRYDKALTGRIETLDDTALISLSETRSARAFMLVGRVSGAFD